MVAARPGKDRLPAAAITLSASQLCINRRLHLTPGPLKSTPNSFPSLFYFLLFHFLGSLRRWVWHPIHLSASQLAIILSSVLARPKTCSIDARTANKKATHRAKKGATGGVTPKTQLGQWGV